MTLSEAYEQAAIRAWGYAEEDCTAYHAWAAVAKRRRSRVTQSWAFEEAMWDAQASEDPDLELAVRTIAEAQASYCDGIPGPRAERLAREIRKAVE